MVGEEYHDRVIEACKVPELGVCTITIDIRVFRVKGVDFMLIIAWRLCLDEMTPSIVCWIRIRSLLLQELSLDLEIDSASDMNRGRF